MDASVDRAGSWMEALLPCRCCVYEATVELDEGRERSWPREGSLSSSVIQDGVLTAGKSNTWRMDGRRNESLTIGRGRMDVEAVVNMGDEKRGASLVVVISLDNEGLDWTAN